MATEITTEKLLDVVQDLHRKIDDGFRGVYDKMDEYRGCLDGIRDKQSALEIELKTRTVLNGVEERKRNKREENKSYFCRVIGAAVILAILGWFYKLFIFHPTLQ